MFTKINNQTFDVSVSLTRVDENSPDKESDKILQLATLQIAEIVLKNDLRFPFPLIEIKYRDKSTNSIIPYLADGYTFLTLLLRLVPITDGEQEIILTHDFFIDDVAVIDFQNINEVIYNISAISYTALNINGFCEYSTNGVEKPSTTIARDILKQIKYPYDTAKPFFETDRTLNYITPSNFTALDNLKYLMQNATSYNRGIFYLIYNMYKQTGKIYSLSDIYTDPDLSIIENYNNFLIPSRAGTEPIGMVSATNLQSSNYTRGATLFNLEGGVDFFNFNYLKRQRTTTKYPTAKTLDVLPKIKSDDLKAFIKPYPSIYGANKYTREEISENLTFNQVWFKADKLLREANIFNITVRPGWLQRDVGQLVNVQCSESIINSYYGGICLNIYTEHIFCPEKEYTTKMTLARTQEFKDKADENT